MKTHIAKHIFCLSIFLLFFVKVTAQDYYAGIEIGGKGVKVSIIEIKNLDIGEFALIKSWTRNTTIAKNISIDGNLDKKDIDDTSYVVLDLYNQLKNEFQIADNNIFIVASSSVAKANNKQELADKIEQLTQRKIEFITPDSESKLIAKGAIPQSKYDNSLILDIGSGSIKGGFIKKAEDFYQFAPLGLSMGTTTLTQKIKNKSEIKNTDDFVLELNKMQDSIDLEVKKMYEASPDARIKENVYVLGGASWAFITLTNPKGDKAYQSFNYTDILNFQVDLLNNYEEKFVTDAYISKDYARVFKAFSREALISGNNLIYHLISNLEEPQNKNYYFVRQGQVAWLIAYIVDSVRSNN